MSEILKITWLSKKIDWKIILEKINLSIKQWEIISFIWPSWWWKTSIIRAIWWLESFDEWEIKICDKIIFANSEHEKAKEARNYIWIVFQEYNIWSHMTVLENVMKPLILTKNMSEEKAKEVAILWLKKVKLENKINAYPKSLSWWQKQRVAIARALAINPKILLFDEITSALDPELTHWILNLIKILAKDWVTMLIITHHMEFARQVSDKIIFVDEWRLIEETNPYEFFENSQNWRIKQFLASMNSKIKDINIYEWIEEFQSFWLWKLNMLPIWTTWYVLWAVWNKWFEIMWEYYEKHEQIMIQKKMKWKMIWYDFTIKEQRAKNNMKDLFEMKIISKETKPLANFNIWWDILVIQIFDHIPKIIEIKNKSLVESYMNYFELMWEIWKVV